MKKFQRVALVIFILLFFNVKSIQAQDTLYNQLRDLNLTQFANKPIDSFLIKLPQNYSNMIILSGSKLGTAGMIGLDYPGNISILIRVKEFTHMNPNNPQKLPASQVWDINVMRKEKIYSIRVYQNDTLINNFNEPD